MYEAYVKHFYYLKKGEMKMSNEFKAGDLVFEVSFLSGIRLIEVTNHDNPIYTIKGNSETYTENGKKFDDTGGVPSLLHATQEMRENLVAIWGEDAVPKLPLRGSELTKRLLEKQKYVICWVNDKSDERARDWPHEICVVCAVEDGGFTLGDGGFAEYAVPIDNNGNEITEIE